MCNSIYPYLYVIDCVLRHFYYVVAYSSDPSYTVLSFDAICVTASVYVAICAQLSLNEL